MGQAVHSIHLVTVIAAVADDKGNIKRLNNYHIKFEIEGNGELVADNNTFTNPREVQWGTAPVLVRSNTDAGDIKVKVSVAFEGIHTPLSGELIIKTVAPKYKLIADKDELALSIKDRTKANENGLESEGKNDCENEVKRLQQELSRLKLKEVEKQQSDFE